MHIPSTSESPISPSLLFSPRSQQLIPPNDLSKATVLFCAGEVDFKNPQSTLSRIRQSASIGIVDGGLRHATSLGLQPKDIKYIVGDFDSADKDLLELYKSQCEDKELKRAKDCTDLEEGIKLALAINSKALIVIFGGLGGRIDHTLSNIYLVLRHPMQVFFESENQVIFGTNDKAKTVMINTQKHTRMTLVALNGQAQNISIGNLNLTFNINKLNFSEPYVTQIQGNFELTVGSGEIVVILDTPTPSASNPIVDWRLKTPLSKVFQWLGDQSIHFREKALSSSTEHVCNIQKSSGDVVFECQRGQTISLIPVNGPVTGIKTSGLKWPCEGLSRGFVGTSNVAMQDGTFTISVESGQLLVIVTNIIDLEMVDTPI